MSKEQIIQKIEEVLPETFAVCRRIPQSLVDTLKRIPEADITLVVVTARKNGYLS